MCRSGCTGRVVCVEELKNSHILYGLDIGVIISFLKNQTKPNPNCPKHQGLSNFRESGLLAKFQTLRLCQSEIFKLGGVVGGCHPKNHATA